MGTVVCLVACSVLPDLGVARLLKSAPFQKLGKLSYSWYLWHLPFLVFAEALLPRISVPARLAVASIALAVAYLSYRFLEAPVRYHPWLVKSPRRTFACAAALAVCSLAGAPLCTRFGARMQVEPEMASIKVAIDDWTRLPFKQCIASVPSSLVLTCSYGDSSSKTHIVLFGDSHAFQWFNPLQRLVEAHHWKLTTVVKSGCPAAAITIGLQSASCPVWRAAAVRQIIALNPSLVLLGSSATYLGLADNPSYGPGVPWIIGVRPLATLCKTSPPLGSR